MLTIPFYMPVSLRRVRTFVGLGGMFFDSVAGQPLDQGCDLSERQAMICINVLRRVVRHAWRDRFVGTLSDHLAPSRLHFP
jgi:hypothetical protein